jgi:hypothetical protein
VIVRLYHADKTVRQDLAQAVQFRHGYVLATQLQGPRGMNVEEKIPFKEILSVTGANLDLVVLIDEGRPEGMWRDPFGEFCDQLFQQKRDAAAATAGYVLLRDRQVLAWFRKALWDPIEDAEEITAYLGRCAPDLFRPYQRPKPKGPPLPPKGPPKPKPKKTPIINAAVTNPRPPPPVPAAPTVEYPAVGRVEPGPPTSPEMPSVILADDLFGDVPAEPPPPDTDQGIPPDTDPNQPVGDVFDDDEETVAGPPPVSAIDPWALLGIPRGSSYEEAKKAYRALILQYHPDKVAHLAPEFRTLAEARTRDINEAFRVLEQELGR